MSSESFFNALADFIRSPVVETPPSELPDDALIAANNVLKTVLDGRLSELRDELVARLRARPSDEFGKRWLEIDEGRVSLSRPTDRAVRPLRARPANQDRGRGRRRRFPEPREGEVLHLGQHAFEELRVWDEVFSRRRQIPMLRIVA